MDKQKLIVFYSRAGENYFGGEYRRVAVGNTEKAAHRIAEAVGGECFKIEQEKAYAEDYQECIRQAEADRQAKARPALKTFPENFDSRREIYLGYPIYWGDMPMAVYTFLEAFDWTGKIIYPFCTHEGSGLSGTVQKIAGLCRGAEVRNGLAICGSAADQCEEMVRKWLAEQKAGR